MILYFLFVGIKLTYGMNLEAKNLRNSREINLIQGSDDEDYSRSSGDYEDIITENEDYSDNNYELPDISPTIYPTAGLDGFTSIRSYEDDYIISVSPSSSDNSSDRTSDGREMRDSNDDKVPTTLILIFVSVGSVILIAIISAIIVSCKKSKSKSKTSYAEAKPVPAPRKPRTIV